MASSSALMESMRALRQRLEEPPARGGGYRPKPSTTPKSPPQGTRGVPPKPSTHSDHVQPSRRVLLARLADARLSYIVGTGTDAEVQRVESRVQVMRDSPGGVQVGGAPVSAGVCQSLLSEAVVAAGVENERRLSKLRAEVQERLDGPDGFRAKNPARWVGENKPYKPPSGDDWHWVQFKEGGQWYHGKHADVDALAVPEERRPSTGAPLRRLLGFLIRTLLRRWSARLEKS